MEKKTKSAEAVQAVVTGGIAAAGAALGVGATPAATVALATGGALLTAFVEPALAFVAARSTRRWQLLLNHYVEGSADNPEVIEGRLQEEADDPDVQEQVVEIARGLADALTDSVVLPMARLLREYRSEKRKVDSFYRGMRRLLADLDEQEFAELCRLLREVSALHFSVDPIMVELYYGSGPAGLTLYAVGHAIEITSQVATAQGLDEFSFPETGDVHGRSVQESERHALGHFDHLPRLLNLLKVNDIATEPTGRIGVAGALIALLPIERVRRVLRLLS